MRLATLSLLTIASLAAWGTPEPVQERPLLSEAAQGWAEGLGEGAVATAEKRQGKWFFGLAGQALAVDGAKKVGKSQIAPEKVIFEIGSISKVFTGILVAQAVKAGELSLDDSLQTLLAKRLPEPFRDPAIGAVTLKQLATHTSCLPRLPSNMTTAYLPDPYAAYDDKALFSYLSKETLKGKAPCAPSYSNLGFSILGVVLETVYEKSWEALVIEKITTPLGMTDTSQNLSEEQSDRFAQGWAGTQKAPAWTFQSAAAAGSLRSTLEDMSHFADALIGGAEGPFEEIWSLLAGDFVEEPALESQIGLALLHSSQDGIESYWHNGGTGGFRSLIRASPTSGSTSGSAVVILASNAAAAPEAWFADWAGEKGRAVDSKKTASAKPELKEVSLPAEALSEYEGVFTIDSPDFSADFTILRRENEIVARLTGQPFAPIFASAKDEFFYKIVDAQLSFHRSDSGQVESLTLHQNGNDLDAKKKGPAPAIQFPSPEALEAYVGEYDFGQFSPGSTITISAPPLGMVILVTGQQPVLAFSMGGDRFELDVVEAALVFERNEAGEVVAVVLHQNGLQMRSPRM